MAVKPEGVRTVVYLQEGEKVIIVKPEANYRLGYPMEDIVYGSTIIEAVRVVWDQADQAWLD